MSALPSQRFPQQFGRYRLLGLLGAGSTSVVYRAEQEQPHRAVALKVFHASDWSAVAERRLRTEADALARLDHPGIARIHECGIVECDGVQQHFVAMELVDGEPLHRFRRTHALSARQCLELVVAICDVIAHAHRRGVVHRDLKPQNILVSWQGDQPVPRVVDLGVARLFDFDGGPHSDTVPHSLVGTLAYMSPEQASGAPDVDTHADVYSLGVICHELCTGHLPIDLTGADLIESVERVKFSPPRLTPIADRSIAGDLLKVLGKALAKAPDDRYHGVQAFADDLRNLLTDRPISVRPLSPLHSLRLLSRRRRGLFAALTVVALAGATALIGLGYGVVEARSSAARVLGVLEGVVSGLAREVNDAGTSPFRRRQMAQIRPQLEALLADQPDHAAVLRLLADVMTMQGDDAVAREDYTIAMPLRQRCDELRRRLLALQPDDALLKAELATDQVRIGDLHVHQGRRREAAAHYSDAHRDFLALAAAAPQVARHVDDLIWSCERMAAMAFADDGLDEVERLLRQMGQLLDQLERIEPDRRSNLSGRSAQFAMQARLALARGDRDGAIHWLQTTLAACTQWTSRMPRDRDALAAQVAHRISLSALLLARGDRDEAGAVLAAAQPLVQLLATTDADLKVSQMLERALRDALAGMR